MDDRSRGGSVTIFAANGDEFHTERDAPRLYIIATTGSHWSSDEGFVYDKCEHRSEGACLRCRIRWLIHLWRNGNHIWYLP